MSTLSWGVWRLRAWSGGRLLPWSGRLWEGVRHECGWRRWLAAWWSAATWYLLPVFSGEHGDVAVYGGGTIESSIEKLSYQLHDRGRAMKFVAEGSTWCDLADLQPEAHNVDVIVLAPEATGTCDGDPVATTVDRLRDDVELVLVASSAVRGDRFCRNSGITVVDPTCYSELLAPSRCPANGGTTASERSLYVDDDGDLTDAGNERVARMVSAAIG